MLQTYKAYFWQVIIWVLLWNEVHCEIQYDGFPFQTIFFQNTTCWNVQTKTSSKLTEYFLQRKARSREQHDTYNSCCSSNQGNTEVSRIVERKVQRAPLWWIRKQNVLRVCREFPNGKKHALLWGLEQITFKPIAYRHTRSMRPVKDMLWADRSQTCKRETKGGKTLANIACCIEQT